MFQPKCLSIAVHFIWWSDVEEDKLRKSGVLSEESLEEGQKMTISAIDDLY